MAFFSSFLVLVAVGSFDGRSVTTGDCLLFFFVGGEDGSCGC